MSPALQGALSLIIASFLLAASAAGLLRTSALNSNWIMLSSSIGLYSASSLCIFFVFRSGVATSLTGLMFLSMIGTIACLQVIGTIFFGEAVSWKALLALSITACVLTIEAPLKPQTPPTSTQSTPQNIGE